MYVISAPHKIRILTKTGFAASIRNLEGIYLREILLTVGSWSMEDEGLPIHKLVKIGKWRQESLFRMLQHLACLPNLAILRLLGGVVICPEYFRGIIDHPAIPNSSLVEFELQFSAETADGRWFYERDDETLERSRSDPRYEEFWEEEDRYQNEYDTRSLDSNDNVRVFGDGPFRTDVVRSDRFRSLPNPTTFLPFLMDSSKAALRIPK